MNRRELFTDARDISSNVGSDDALTDADALIVVTEWAEFKIPKFTFIEKALKHKIIFDGRNIYSPEQMKEFGYMYYGIGRKDN